MHQAESMQTFKGFFELEQTISIAKELFTNIEDLNIYM